MNRAAIAFAGSLLSLAATSCRRTTSPSTPAASDGAAAHAIDAHANGPTAAAPRDAGPSVHFDPRWSCRIAGPGRVARMPRVSTPPPRPGAPRGSIEDTIPLVDGRILRREMVRDANGALDLDRGRVALYASEDGGVDSRREYAVRPGEQEMLFVDAHGAGIAFWNGRRIVAERVDATNEETLEASASDLTRPCSGTSGDSLRMWPIFPEALPFPRVQGMPPSVADARYTLSRDEHGMCVSRLEGEGPWGRVFVDAVPDAGMRGDLSLSESVNPVTCGPGTAERPSP